MAERLITAPISTASDVAPDRDTQRVTRRAPALVGTAPLTLALDKGGTNTRVRAARGGEVIGELTYTTPQDYNTGMATLAKATNELLGLHTRPDAVGVSVAGKVSEDGKEIESAGDLQDYGYVGKQFAYDVAEATRVVGSDGSVIILNDCGAGAFAESTTRPDIESDEVYITWSTGLGGALTTPEGWILSDEPGHRGLRQGGSCGCGKTTCIEGHIGGGAIKRKFGVPGEAIKYPDPRWKEIRGDLFAGMDITFTTYREAGLDVARAAFTGSAAHGQPRMMRELGVHLQERFGAKAPIIAEAHFGDESPLVGAERAADQLAKLDGTPPILIYKGIEVVKGLRSAR